MRHFLAVGLFLATLISATSADVPTVKIAAFKEAPTIDGDLSDATWQKATKIELERVLYQEDPPMVKTIAWLGYDDDWLYIGVRCEDAKGRKIPAKHHGRDSKYVGQDDSIEIFLNPAGRGHTYFHFALGAGNAKYEQLVQGEKRDLNWTVLWRSATLVGDGSWSAELAIPLYVLGQTKITEQPLTFNITRNRRTEPTQHITWAPVGTTTTGKHGFHDPASFGVLTGLEGHPIRGMFAPLIVSADNVTPYQEKEGVYSYGFQITVTNPGGVVGETPVIIEDTATAGETKRYTRKISVPPTGEQDYVMEVPVEFPADRTARVALGTKLQSDEWIAVQGIESLTALVAYPNLSLYCGEPTGRFIVGTPLSDSEFAKRKLSLEIEIRNQAGKTVLKKSYRKTENQGAILTLPVSKWTPDTYPVTVRLLDAKSRIISREESSIRVAAPPPPDIMVTKIDHERMCMLLNGKPLFPISFLNGAGFGEVDVFDREKRAIQQVDLMERFVQAEFNHVVHWACPGRHTQRTQKNLPWTEKDDEWLAGQLQEALQGYQTAHNAGLPVISPTTGFIALGHNYADWNRRDHKLVLEKLPVVIEKFKNFPGLLAWLGIDDPSPGILDLVIEQAALIRSVDPYHVQYSTSRGGLGGGEYDGYDVYGRHHYWGPDHTPNGLASWVKGGYQTAKMGRAPIWATPQGPRLSYRRELSPNERRCGIYLPLIQGAKGVMFFSYPFASLPVHDVTYRVISYTVKEIQMMAPILLEQRPPQNIEMNMVETPQPATVPPLPKPRTLYDPSWPGRRGPGGENMPLVQALVHNKPEGGELILVANSGKVPVRVNFALSSLGNKSKVRGFFTKKNYEVRNGRFAEEFEPYGVRVLETFGSNRKQGDPVSLGMNVALPPRPKVIRPNLVENAGFEEEGEWTDWKYGKALGKWRFSEKYEIVTSETHSGKKALKLEGLPEKRSTAHQDVELKPNTAYRISLWTKQNLGAYRMRPEFFLNIPRDSYLGSAQLIPDSGAESEAEWIQYTRTLTTKDKPVQGSILLRVREGTEGHILIDDVRLEDLSTPTAEHYQPQDRRVDLGGYEKKESAWIWSGVDDAEQALLDRPAVPGENIVRNSSFEEYTLPMMPDNWLARYFGKSYMGQDDAEAYHGRYSLRLMPGDRQMSYMHWSNWQYETPYVFSAYVKASKEDATVRLSLLPLKKRLNRRQVGGIYQDFKIGTKWQRIEWSFTIPRKPTEGWVGLLCPGIRNASPMKNGQFYEADDPRIDIWVDAVQLEVGTKATAYKPDPYRAPKVDPKWFSDQVFQHLDN